MPLEKLEVVTADSDMRGAQKENFFLALDRDGKPLGSLLIYPFFDQVIEREHPLNLYLHLRVEGGVEASEPVKDVLLEHALRRATEIKHETGQSKDVCLFSQAPTGRNRLLSAAGLCA